MYITYTSIYAKLVLLELALYDVPIQSTVSLFWLCIALKEAVEEKEDVIKYNTMMNSLGFYV